MAPEEDSQPEEDVTADAPLFDPDGARSSRVASSSSRVASSGLGAMVVSLAGTGTDDREILKKDLLIC
jgi:hypothetical protein